MHCVSTCCSQVCAHAQCACCACARAVACAGALDEAKARQLVAAFRRVEVPAGSHVVTQGEQGDHFYVIDSGLCDVLVRRQTEEAQRGGGGGSPEDAGDLVQRLGPGNSFGELALLNAEPRCATVRARTPVVLWRLARDDFALRSFIDARRAHALRDKARVQQVSLHAARVCSVV